MAHFAEQPGLSPTARANALVIALYPQVEAVRAELSELDDFRAVADRAELTESVKRALKAWESIHTSYRGAVVEARRDLIRIDELDDRTYFGVAAALYALDNPENSQALQESGTKRLEMERLVEDLKPGAPVMGFDVDEMRGTSELGPLIAGRVRSVGRTALDSRSASVHIGMQVELTRQEQEPTVVTRAIPSVLMPENPAYLWAGEENVRAFRMNALGRGVDPREVQMAVTAIGPSYD